MIALKTINGIDFAILAKLNVTLWLKTN